MTEPAAPPTLTLEAFEADVRAGNHAAALVWLREALHRINAGSGTISWIGAQCPTGLKGSERIEHMATRLAEAVGALLSDPALELSLKDMRQIAGHWRWISTLFGATALRNADHFVRRLLPNGFAFGDAQVDPSTLAKALLLYTGNADLPIGVGDLWRRDRGLAAIFFFALLSSRLVATPAAKAKKDALLAWAPRHLDQVEIGEVSVMLLPAVGMMSSYSDLPEKHAVKKPINRMLRRQLLKLGLGDLDPVPVEGRDKPVMLVILEWFHRNHSVFRTHSATLAACRDRFHLVGVGTKHVDADGRALFHEFIDLPESDQRLDLVAAARAAAGKHRPDIVYYPSVGMFEYTIWLATLRLAPIQCTSTGHTATTHSEAMDYYIVDEDFIGDPACFSEKVLAMPVGAMPHVSSLAGAPPNPPGISERPEKLRVAVPATVMKVTTGFLEACAKIRAGATRPIEFHFFLGATAELLYLEAKRAIHAYVPDAVVWPGQPPEHYMARFGQCDIFLSPFPFGSWNSIVDAVRLAVPGICLSGREVHAHADEGFFRRFGLPDWLVTRNPDAYVAAALKLIGDDAARVAISKDLEALDLDAALFTGTPEIFADRLATLVAERASPCPISSS